jgi:hypothetical protein
MRIGQSTPVRSFSAEAVTIVGWMEKSLNSKSVLYRGLGGNPGNSLASCTENWEEWQNGVSCGAASFPMRRQRAGGRNE